MGVLFATGVIGKKRTGDAGKGSDGGGSGSASPAPSPGPGGGGGAGTAAPGGGDGGGTSSPAPVGPVQPGSGGEGQPLEPSEPLILWYAVGFMAAVMLILAAVLIVSHRRDMAAFERLDKEGYLQKEPTGKILKRNVYRVAEHGMEDAVELAKNLEGRLQTEAQTLSKAEKREMERDLSVLKRAIKRDSSKSKKAETSRSAVAPEEPDRSLDYEE